jgi:hypothetical protein
MLLKKLLLAGVLVLSSYGLRGAALAEMGRPAAPASASASTSRLSNLILPLPPLAIPDLLLPPYNFPSFDSERLDQSLQLYLQYLRTHGRPDILIMGSSRSLQGIDPAALEEGLAAQGYPGLKVYNFGINGATAQVMNLLVQDILQPNQLPKLIIWGDGSRAFNAGRPDRTYGQIIASAGYQRVLRGEYPIPAQTMDWEVPTFVTANKSLAASAVAAASVASDLTDQGFQAITDQYDPNRYYQRFPWVPGQFDGDYRNFSLGGPQTEATVSIAQFARQQGITLVVVNLPLTRDYIDPVRRRHETAFQQHMWRLASQEQFMFRDLSQQPTLTQNQYFADPSHINQQGARAVALHLAADQTIPWRVVQLAP